MIDDLDTEDMSFIFWFLSGSFDYIIFGTLGDYLDFVKAHLQGCLADTSRASVNFFLFQINLHHSLHHFCHFVIYENV